MASQRQALIQLHTALRMLADPAGAERWIAALRGRGLGAALLDPADIPPIPAVIDALERLAAPDDVPSRSVSPIEILQFLLVLARTREAAGLPPGVGGEPVRSLVARLLAGGNANRVPELEARIDVLGKAGFDVIRLEGLDDRFRLLPPGGRRGPVATATMEDGLQRLRKVASSFLSFPLTVSLASARATAVDARLYKTMIDGRAEFAVHLRTTVAMDLDPPLVVTTGLGPPAPIGFDDFRRVLDPNQWPAANGFWMAMDPVPIDGAPGTPPNDIVDRARVATMNADTAQWTNTGLFHEKVGFRSPGGADEELFPETYLHFATTRDATKRPALASYALMSRQQPLLVDDGSIEIRSIGTVVVVTTAKSLYLDGAGSWTEAAGIVAYTATFMGWATNTLSLVTHIVDPP